MIGKKSALDDKFLLAASTIGGLLLIALAFVPWINYLFEADGFGRLQGMMGPWASWNVDGFNVQGLAGIGDGYIVAGAGVVVAAISAIVLLGPDRPSGALLLLLAAGGLAFGVAAYDLSREFGERMSRAGAAGNVFGTAHGDATVALPAIACIGLAVATIAALLLLRQRNELSVAASTDAQP
jgi:hypothetical protein